jgi:lipoprotein-releasing system permease protein
MMVAAASLKDTLGELLGRWEGASLGQRIGVGVAALLIVVVSFVVARRLLSDVRRRYLWLLTGFAALLALGLGVWAHSLPEPRRASFVLSHQIVRVGAALSGTAFVLGFMALALPWVLDRLEHRGFVSFVAARHVRAGKSGFLTVISLLSIAGVAISSFALCAVVSIMGGFGADLKAKILGNNSHISIDTGGDSAGFGAWDDILDTVRLVPGVNAATPVVAGEAMASSQSNTAGVLVRGVDPESIGSVIDLVQNIEVGKFDYLIHPEQLTALSEDEAIWIGRGGHRYLKGPSAPKDTTQAPGDLTPDVAAAIKEDDAYPGLVLGRELAKTLHVYVGDEVTLIAPVGDLGPMGVMPRTRKFRVAAVFYSGMYEYDSSHAYMELGTAQEFLDLGGAVSQIEVKVAEEDRAVEIRDRLAEALAGKDLRVRDWKEMNKGLFSALKLEKVVTFIILSIAIVVGSFCIICTLLLMVTEKSKEIAILKAQGASDVGILKVFMTEGFIIGGIGTVFGVVTGLVSCLGLLWFGVRLDPDVYYVDRLPINVDPIDYAIVTLCALGITLAATIYPALAASRLRPVEGIRYE